MPIYPISVLALLALLVACDSSTPAPKATVSALPTAPDAAALLAQGLAHYRAALAPAKPDRSALESLYQQAITALEQAQTQLPPAQQTVELFQTLWLSYRNLAFIPVTFEQGVHPDHGVVPAHMHYMKRAQAVFAEAQARFPNDPAVAPAIGNQLHSDADALLKIYAANAERQWNELNQSAGYRRPETYSEK